MLGRRNIARTSRNPRSCSRAIRTQLTGAGHGLLLSRSVAGHPPAGDLERSHRPQHAHHCAFAARPVCCLSRPGNLLFPTASGDPPVDDQAQHLRTVWRRMPICRRWCGNAKVELIECVIQVALQLIADPSSRLFSPRRMMPIPSRCSSFGRITRAVHAVADSNGSRCRIRRPLHPCRTPPAERDVAPVPPRLDS